MTRLVAVIVCLMAIAGGVVGDDETLAMDFSVGIGGKYVTRHWIRRQATARAAPPLPEDTRPAPSTPHA